ncbi:hypothetical protein R5M92_14635 [Halomonas sp. Bachu 37]|uniref:hypothetical protein n=1 Tax=Halomonas kashgarensis TaxID=3084920 RepID=UPI003216781F
MILIQESSIEHFEPDFQWQHVSLNSSSCHRIDISHAWIEWKGKAEARLWRLRYEPGADQHVVRLVRMFLMRLHCDQEALHTVLSLLYRKDEKRIILNEKSSETRLLQSFLIKTARRLLGPIDRKVGPYQQVILTPDLLDVVCGTMHAAEPGFRESLLDLLSRCTDLHHNELERVRELLAQYVLENNEQPPSIVYKILEKTVNNTITIGHGNNVTVAKYMKDISNSVNQNVSQSAEPDEAKRLIKQLTKQIADIAENLPPEKAKQMGDDVETLSKEAARPQPRQIQYQVSLQGLIEAAKAVGELAKPVVDTLTKLCQLLLP